MSMVYRNAAVCVLLGFLLSLPVLAVTQSVKSKKSNPIMRAQPVRKAARNAVDARGDWWMYRHDPQHTGRSSFNVPETNAQLWKVKIGDFAFQSPTIGSDGTIYVGSVFRRLYAFNPDGTKKWEFATGDIINSSPAIGSDGTIYVGSCDNNLHAINPDGTAKWKYATGDSINSSPAIGSDGTIYVGSCDNNLYAINPDGTAKWKYATDDWINSSPAIGSDGTIYVGSCDNNLYAINPNGTKKWEFATGDKIHSSPAIGSDGTIYIGSYDGKLYAINSNGTKKWEFATGASIDSSPAIGSDETIYVGSQDNKLYAINPNGTKKWEFATYGWIDSSPAIDSNGTIYVGSDDGKFYAINPDGSEKRGYSYLDNMGDTVEIKSSPAIDCNGTVYFTYSLNISDPKQWWDDGYLVAIGTIGLLVNCSGPSISSTTSGPVNYNVTYTNATTVTLSASDITLNKTGTANGTVSITGSGTYMRTVTISNITGNGTLGISIAEGTAFNSSKTAPAAGPSKTFNVLNPGAAWSGISMVSIPIIPDATAPASNPNRTDPKIMVGFSDNNWFWFDPAANNYKQYPNIKTWYDPRTDAPYRGFWAKFVGTPAIPAGTIPDQTTPKTIHLLPGWNLIGQPFISPVSWDVSKIQVQVNGADPKALSGASDIAGDYAWGWDNVNGKYYLVYDPVVVPGAVGVLQPWQAYWFMAKVECDLIIPAP